MKRRVVVGLVAPFVIFPLLARLAVGPVGDAVASAVKFAAPGGPRPTAAPAEEDCDEIALLVRPGDEADKQPQARRPSSTVVSAPAATGSTASRSTDAGHAPSGASPGAASAARIVVPAATIAKALEEKKVRARDEKGPDGKPFGVKLRGVSRYGAGLEDGDVVIEVGGVRVHTTSEMTEQGLRQAASGARVTGKVLRGDATWDVVLELPQKS